MIKCISFTNLLPILLFHYNFPTSGVFLQEIEEASATTGEK